MSARRREWPWRRCARLRLRIIVAPMRTSPGKWVIGETDDDPSGGQGGDDWRAQLQARFGSSTHGAE